MPTALSVGSRTYWRRRDFATDDIEAVDIDLDLVDAVLAAFLDRLDGKVTGKLVMKQVSALYPACVGRLLRCIRSRAGGVEAADVRFSNTDSY
jgi:hypothetical protein